MPRTPNERRHDQRKNVHPVGDALALVGEGDDALTLELGPVWKSDKGNLNFRMNLFPLAWLDPTCKRVVVIKMRDTQGGGR